MANIKPHKERIPAAVLSFFLGWLGVHRFYLGQTGLGLLYLIFSWTGIPWLISMIDFISLLSMNERSFDIRYNNHALYPGQTDYQRRSDERGNIPPRLEQRNQQSQHPQPQRQVQEQTPHRQILEEINQVRREILQNFENNNDDYAKDILLDIKKMLERYISQTRELVERDRKISRMTSSGSIKEVDTTMFDLQAKLASTQNDALKREYQNTIDKYVQHRRMLQDLADQREMIKLRLDSTLMSLKQIKFDLIKMEGLRSQDERKRLFESFEEKTRDLSEYLDALRESYESTDLGGI